MLYLQFRAGQDRYVIEAKKVVEVVPYVLLKRIPAAPAFIPGLMVYRGKRVPVIDICRLINGYDCPDRLGSRIAVADYDAAGEKRLVGLLLENITETAAVDESTFSGPGVTLKEHPYFGSVAVDSRGIMQKVEIDSLLSQEVRELIFGQVGDEDPI